MNLLTILRSAIGLAALRHASALKDSAQRAGNLALLGVVLACGGFSHAWAASSSELKTDQVRATLVAHAPEGVAAGKSLWLGLRFEHQPLWLT